MSVKKGGLGKGIESLFEDNFIDTKQVSELRISEIEPNREQPRKDFDQQALQELSDSISQHGLIQPIVVRPMNNGTYQIIAGERRWRASRMAGLEKVPVVIREMDDTTATEIALIENLQREDLNPVEEAIGYKTLIDNYNMTQEQVAEIIGKSRPAITNALRLLGLNKKESDALRNKEISSGHARALLSFKDEKLREEAFKLAKSGASVREIEDLSRSSKSSTAARRPRVKNVTYIEVEESLSSEIGRKVRVSGNGKTGVIHVEFFDNEDLFDIAKKLAGEK